MDISSGHLPTTNSSLLGWLSRHCPLPPSSLPSFLQHPIPLSMPPSSTTTSDKDQVFGSRGDEDDEIHGTEPASEEEELAIGGGFKLTTARMFNEVLRNLPAVGWLSLPSSSLPPFPQHPPQAPIPSPGDPQAQNPVQAPIPSPSMATPSPSPPLHISDINRDPQNPVQAPIPSPSMATPSPSPPLHISDIDRDLQNPVQAPIPPSSMTTPSPSPPLHISDIDRDPQNPVQAPIPPSSMATPSPSPPLHISDIDRDPQNPVQAPIPPSSMATPSPSPPLHISDVDLPGDPQAENPMQAPIPSSMATPSPSPSLLRIIQNPVHAEPAAHIDMGMMRIRKVKLPGRRRLCKLSNNSVSSDQDQLQDVGSSSAWEMEEPSGDEVVQEVVAEYHDTDAAAAEEEQLPDFEMEATVGTGKPPYKLQARIFNELYTHQREGLSWLWSLHCRGTGGILGDDMGLGKTMQVSAFLAGLFHSGLIRRVLVVATPTILTNWVKELTVVGLRHKIRIYYGPKKDARNYELQHAFKEGGILLTTYEFVRINYKEIRGDFYDDEEDGEMWNYVILDEAQLIKNSTTQRSECVLQIPSVHRIAISGTPIQNNLKEMWTIFSFCCPEVLGDKDEFRKIYELPIKKGNDKNASNRSKHIGSYRAKEFRERIKPYFLRRMKSEVSLETSSTDHKQLPKKNELIIWLKLTDCQRQLYKAFLKCELVHLAASRGNPLAAITVMKKICDHPQLVTKRGAEHILEGMDGMLNNQEMGMAEKMALNLAYMAHEDDAMEVGPEVSCKLSFILALLRNLLEEGHHVLIFSQTCIMLNLIQEAILLEGYSFLRMDGKTRTSERERIVKDFQEGLGAQIFLLTTKVAGVGLTLTKAARVILVEPDWNPSTDNQSVDRVHRIGQEKDVIVYRLMTSATVEEKMYKSQVLKGALFRAATEKNEQTRYFSQSDTQDLFSLPEQGFDVSLTQKQLQEEHGHPLDMDELLREHIEFLEQQQGIAGVTHHRLLFSKTEVLPMLSENDALGGGADPNPKDKCVADRTNTNSENTKEINQLTETLERTTLEAKLPECADQIVDDLDNEKLTVIPEVVVV